MTTVFAIITSNYLAEARVMMESVAQKWPETRRVVFTTDSPLGKFDPMKENFQVIEASSIGVARYLHLAFAFSPAEFCFVMKPFCAAHLLRQNGNDKVVYLDADMVLFRRPTELEETLDTKSIVLTPHRIDPGINKTLGFEHLQDGLFNAGFFAISKTEKAITFLKWWGNQIKEPSNVRAEWFWDQGWLNLVPLYFDDLGILKHPGYNVAFWNLAERSMENTTNGTWECHGRELALFHFSLFDPKITQKLTGDKEFIPLNISQKLLPLIHDYGTRLKRADWALCHSLPYDYAQFADGKPVTRAHRMFFRQRFFSGLPETVDPFDPKMEPRGLGSLYNYDHPLTRMIRLFKGTRLK